MIRKYLTSCTLIIAFMVLMSMPGLPVSVKIKDITIFDGMKTNQVIGYGLVVGLQGTGDSRSSITKSSLQNMLNNLGIEAEALSSKNCAAVLLTAELSACVHSGDRVNVSVSSIGDAKSLTGGTLVQSALKGADDVIYVVAQGAVSIPGLDRGRRSVKTAGVVVNGGLIEKDIQPEVVKNGRISLLMNNWNHAQAYGIIKAVKEKYPESDPVLSVNGKIDIKLIKDISIEEFMTNIGEISVDPAQSPVVVIHEKDGTIATGGSVKISRAMVSREGLTIEIKDAAKRGSAAVINDAVSVADIVDTLNSVGASTADIIAILKALKDSGSLHAELIVR